METKTIKLKCGHTITTVRPIRFDPTANGENAVAIVHGQCEHYTGEVKIRAAHFAPALKTLERYAFDGIARTPDGCKTEPDGHCRHGLPSWLLIVGVI